MKYKIYFSILTIFVFCSCQFQKAQTQVTTNKKSLSIQNNTEQSDQEIVLDKKEELGIEESFVEKDSLKIKNFELKKVKTKKKIEGYKRIADLENAVLFENGKQVKVFEGTEHPLGNDIDFGLFSFASDGNNQIIISDTSNRYEREWIIDLSNGYKLLFDSGEYDIYDTGLAVVDQDDDGVYEITAIKTDYLFGFPNLYIPRNRIIFKFDKQIQKFLPTSHKMQDFTMKDLAESLERFEQDEEKRFSDVLNITLKYIYAGKEPEGWEFFDKNFVPDVQTFPIKVENKEQAKAEIIKYLSKNPIYQFIKNDSKNK